MPNRRGDALNVSPTGPAPDSGSMTVRPPDDGDPPVAPAPLAAVHDVRATLGRLIVLATGSENARPLVDAAWQELRRPLAVVDAAGVLVASSPFNGGADAAVRLATTCAAGPAEPAPGWIARGLHDEGRTVGWLAVHRPEVASADDDAVVDALSRLLAAQLGRAALRRNLRTGRQATIKERVVTDPGPDVAGLLAEAETLGLRFAPVYWPSLIAWSHDALGAEALDEATRVWEAAAPSGSFLVAGDGALALLYAEWVPGTIAQPDVEPAVRQVVAVLARQRPPLAAHGVLGERSVPIDRLHAHVTMLRQLRQYATRGTSAPAVVPVRRFALDRLLEGISPARAHSFVAQCVGPLIAYDERHGSNLQATLELALEYPRRDDAARAAFMHRNTFRRRLQQALELVDADLDDPDQRLALHVALKLHRHPRLAATGSRRPRDPSDHALRPDSPPSRAVPVGSGPGRFVR
jgi:hypothetical protein